MDMVWRRCFSPTQGRHTYQEPLNHIKGSAISAISTDFVWP